MRHPCCQNTRKVRHVADVKYQQFRRVDLNQGQSAQIIAGATAPVAKVSDQCGPVTVCSNPLGVWPRRVDATRWERRCGWPWKCPGGWGRAKCWI